MSFHNYFFIKLTVFSRIDGHWQEKNAREINTPSWTTGNSIVPVVHNFHLHNFHKRVCIADLNAISFKLFVASYGLVLHCPLKMKKLYLQKIYVLTLNLTLTKSRIQAIQTGRRRIPIFLRRESSHTDLRLAYKNNGLSLVTKTFTISYVLTRRHNSVQCLNISINVHLGL